MPLNNKKGFTIIEVLATLLIIGILGAIAIPSYYKYIRKARVSEALTNLNTIATYQKTYFNEARHYLCLTANPVEVSKGGEKQEFDPYLSAGNPASDHWHHLGNIVPSGTKVYFQYRGWAGRFDSSTTGTLAENVTCMGANNYTFNYSVAKSMVGNMVGCAGTISAQKLGIPIEPNKDFFFLTAIADQDGDDKCSLFVKVNGRPDIYKKDQIE